MSTLWHYVQNGQSLGPVPEAQLKALLASGTLRPVDLVWREGMTAWSAIQDLPELRAAAVPLPELAPPPQAGMGAPPAVRHDPAEGVSPEAVDLLRRTKPWVRFLSVLGILSLVVIALGAVAMAAINTGPFQYMGMAVRIGMAILYLLLAALHIPPVLFLSRYASRIRTLVEEPSSRHLEDALRAQKSFWKYLGMFTLIMLSLYLAVLLGALAVALVMNLGRKM